MATRQETFEEALQEFIEKSRDLIDKESDENLPPWPPCPFEQKGPPYEFSQRFDPAFIARYALSIGDDNPIYTDPQYGKGTRYGAQVAPGPILALVRYPSVHGATRPGGYPVANFISGAAWEFFDGIRAGSKFKSSKVTKEIFQKPGSRGNLRRPGGRRGRARGPGIQRHGGGVLHHGHGLVAEEAVAGGVGHLGARRLGMGAYGPRSTISAAWSLKASRLPATSAHWYLADNSRGNRPVFTKAWSSLKPFPALGEYQVYARASLQR